MGLEGLGVYIIPLEQKKLIHFFATDNIEDDILSTPQSSGERPAFLQQEPIVF
jgi:hypothetical protein